MDINCFICYHVQLWLYPRHVSKPFQVSMQENKTKYRYQMHISRNSNHYVIIQYLITDIIELMGWLWDIKWSIYYDVHLWLYSRYNGKTAYQISDSVHFAKQGPVINADD